MRLRYSATVRSTGTWFRCFAEVPGVAYPSDPQRRARLPERDAVPEVHTYNFEGKRSVSLSWTARDGSTSASPVHRLAFGNLASETSEQSRERVLSALELPGELMDYHFVIQSVLERLYTRRRAEPKHLPFVEWLAWFDAKLVESHQSSFRISLDNHDYINVFALSFLVELHEREGYLHEALALAERFARFRPHVDTVTDLRARVALLRAEHA